MNKKSGFLLTKNTINKLNTSLIIGEFVFIILWVFAGYFLAKTNYGAFIGLFFLAYGVYGETFFAVTMHKIKPIYRKLGGKK